MAVTNGFTVGYSEPVVLDAQFGVLNNQAIVSTFINVATSSGTIVYENSNGVAQVTNGFVGRNPISATAILTSATINSVLYTTSATGMYWESGVSA